MAIFTQGVHHNKHLDFEDEQVNHQRNQLKHDTIPDHLELTMVEAILEWGHLQFLHAH